jgi:hypothetical protein
MIAKSDEIPFDVAWVRAIHFNINDLDDVERTKEELKKQISFLNENADNVESPLSTALLQLNLKGSPMPVERALGELASEIAQMKALLFNNLKFLRRFSRLDPWINDWRQWVSNPDFSKGPSSTDRQRVAHLLDLLAEKTQAIPPVPSAPPKSTERREDESSAV